MKTVDFGNGRFGKRNSNQHTRKRHLVNASSNFAAVTFFTIFILYRHRVNSVFKKVYIARKKYLYPNKSHFKVELPPPDLGPGSSVQETLGLLREVLSSHDAAITPLQERQKDYEKVCLT